MTRLLDTLRMVILAIGAIGSALLADHVVVSLAVVAITVASVIGLYELTHRES